MLNNQRKRGELLRKFPFIRWKMNKLIQKYFSVRGCKDAAYIEINFIFLCSEEKDPYKV